MTALKILKYQLRDHLRSKWALFYALFFAVLTEALLRFAGDAAQTVLSLMNVVLIVVPLASLIFGSIYLYSSREFTILLLSQPIRRSSLYWGLYWGLSLVLTAGFVLGVGIPFLLHGLGGEGAVARLLLLLASGVLLTLIFVALSFLIAVRIEDRVAGIAAAMSAWLFLSVVYDGLLLLCVFLLSDYPLEKPLLLASLANPVDLARILLLLNFDVSTLMGYTGANFKAFFGSSTALPVSLAFLTVWLLVPLLKGGRMFGKKDF